MARRLLDVPQIGEVILAKRHGSTTMRLSITQTGQVRVGMPYWTPYAAGLQFVKKHEKWLQKQLLVHAPKQLNHGSRIGKAHTLIFIKGQTNGESVYIRISSTTIEVKTNLDPSTPAVQMKVTVACEQVLKHEAKNLLPQRVESISSKYELPYRSVKIRKLTSRWGSCSSRKDISLSYFLVQLPWELVDYVILHELAHTVFHDHSRSFWAYMEERMPNLHGLKKQVKAYKPRIEPQ